MTDQKKQGIFAEDELHRKIVSPCSAEEKISMYAAWAPDYDKHISSTGYVAHVKLAHLLKDSMEEKATKLPVDKPIRIMDIGCGTGLCGGALSEMWGSHKHPIHVIGVDFSPDMLAKARASGNYAETVEANIMKPFEISGGPIHFLASSGVFVEGHVGPEAMPTSFNHVEEGGTIVISIRTHAFTAQKKEYMNWIEEAGCVLLDSFEDTYYNNLSGVYQTAHYGVLRKVRPPRY
eukprot:GFKZ01005407.1.p1 GENE.GFKZ01005407.1~~GFKZ01005407.1.p1  ORF type:complete len:234 (+),score=32.47 GFKZ01005407.1:210-911(+)